MACGNTGERRLHPGRDFPSTWFAGKTYHITIIGNNFQNVPAYGYYYNHVYATGPTEISMLLGTGTVTVSSLTVLGSNVIQAVVTPLATDPTETAQVQIWDVFVDGGYPYVRSATPVQILGAPTITWEGKPISATNPPPVTVASRLT